MTTATPSPVSLTETAAPPNNRVRRRPAARALYAFDDCPPDRLIRLCRILCDRGYRGDSALYVMPHTHRFYLSIEETIPEDGAPLSPTLLLEEFGCRIVSASILCCLGEHARCLCAHDAIPTMAALMLHPK